MIFYLLLVALVSIPLILEIQLAPWLSDTISSYRLTKDFLALGFATGISLLHYYKGKSKPFKNKWLLFLVLYLVIQRFISPTFSIPLFKTDISNFWIYKPLSYALIYFGMLLAINSMALPHKRKIIILKTMSWTGFLSAIYLIIQWLNLDQWQNIVSNVHVYAQTSPKLSSFMTQSNYSGSFIVLTLPFVLYFRKYYRAIIMIIAVLLTKGQMAIGCMGVVLLCYTFYLSNKIWKLMLVICLVLCSLFAAGYLEDHPEKLSKLMRSSGRYAVWRQVAKDIKKSPFTNEPMALTGYSLGASRYVLMPTYENTDFIQVHNEPLEFTANTGLIGLTLLILSIFWLIKRVIPFIIVDEISFTLLLSFVSICIFSLATFIWQIDPHRFYTVTILGMLHNIIRKGEKDEKI